MYRNLPFMRFTIPFLLVIVLFLVYLATMAPELTWANGGSDGGDLITAMAVGGVPHPTGYPLYLLIAKVFQAIPIGSLAYRTNILSAFCMAFASLILYVVVKRYLEIQGRESPQLAGIVAGFSFGLAPLVWSQAVITEVYALHALLVAVLFLLYVQPSAPNPIRGLVLGLAMGNHVTSIFLVPIFIADIFWDKKTSPRQKWTFLLYQSLWVFAGLAVYLILPFRALSMPPVNWGNAQTFDRFWWLVTGELYWGQLLIPPQNFFYRTASWIAILFDNFSLPGLYLGLLGVIYFFKRSRYYAFTLWAAVTFSFFSIQYSTVDSNIYLIPVIFCFAAWMGTGTSGILEIVSRQSVLKVLLATMLTLFISISAIYTAPEVDASQDERAVQFTKMVFEQTPAKAILFVEGDGAVFSLWYQQYVMRERPDLFIVASTLLHFPWYIETLQATYPDLDLSEPFPWTQTIIEMNPGYPYCHISDVNVTRIMCAYP